MVVTTPVRIVNHARFTEWQRNYNNTVLSHEEAVIRKVVNYYHQTPRQNHVDDVRQPKSEYNNRISFASIQLIIVIMLQIMGKQ